MISPFCKKLVILFLVLKLCNCWTNQHVNKPNKNLDQFVRDLSKQSLDKEFVQASVNKFNKPIFSYVGCYADRREARDIYEKEYTYITKFNKSIPTVELCVNLCAQDGYTVAGVQAFDECYCGNTYGRYNTTDDSNCFFQCAGKYTCGGYNANSVYIISSFQTTGKENDRSLIATMPNNPCASSPCLNSGMCITLMNDKGVPHGYICRCTNPQDTGVFCEERNFCFSNPCLNGGACTNTFTGFSCKCASGYTGFNCNTPTFQMAPTSQTFNCFEDSNHCRNGGTCFRLMDLSYMCKCPPNYRGTYCEIFDMCSTLPCQNNGVCTFNEPDGFHCNCTKDFYGQKCEYRSTCLNFTCYNGGECNMDPMTHKNFCSCPKNYAGFDCRECKPQFTGEYCDRCAPGYVGKNCELTINVCSPNPCMRGSCAVEGPSYKCICEEGWRGRNCTEKNCLIKSCLNEGVCTSKYDSANKIMDFKCECPSNYYGDQCEFVDPNPCVSNPCLNDEECVLQQDNSFICIKSVDFCERVKPCNNFSECVYSKENNTFYCRCLNGEKLCDHPSEFQFKNSSEAIQIFNMEPKLSRQDVTEAIKTAQEEKSSKTHLPKFGFNLDNIYLILPLGLVVVVILAFGTVVGYFGLKSRRRRADFGSKGEIRTINYLNENAAFTDTLNKKNHSSSEYPTCDKEFAESYGRV